MKELLQFANTVSPLGVIALLVIVVIMLINKTGFAGKVRSKLNSVSTTPSEPSNAEASLESIAAQLKTIAGNHLHDLPNMKETLDAIAKEQILQGNRLTSVETTIKILLKT